MPKISKEKFKVYKNVPGNPNSLVDNNIWEVVEDKNGNIWVSTTEGISVFDRVQEKFTNFVEF